MMRKKEVNVKTVVGCEVQWVEEKEKKKKKGMMVLT